MPIRIAEDLLGETAILKRGLLALLLIGLTADGRLVSAAAADYTSAYETPRAAPSAPSSIQNQNLFRDRLRSNPRDLEALRRLAQLTDNPPQCRESIALSRQALDLAPLDVDLRLQLGRSLATCRDNREAVAVYRELAKARPNDAGLQAEFGELLLRLQLYDEATSAFRRAHALDASKLGSVLGLASSLVASESYAEALSAYDEALRLSPGNYDALQGKAYVLYWSHRYPEARQTLETLNRLHPADHAVSPKVLRDIAEAEEQAHWIKLRPAPNAPPADFVKYYCEVLSSHPRDKTALLGLAYHRALTGEYTGAIRDYRRALELYPHERSAKLELARLLGAQGEYKASMRLYKEVLSQTPDDAVALEGLAHVMAWSGHPREGARIYRKLQQRDPDNLDYRLEIARINLQTGDYAEVRNELAVVFAQQPRNEAARLITGQLDLQQHEYEAARRQFEGILLRHPSNPEALLGKARVAYYTDDLSTAESISRKLAADHPGDYEAVMLLAAIDRARSQRREALDLLRRAERLSPNNPETKSLRQRVIAEAPLGIRTVAAYDREIARGATTSGFEDLRTFVYGTAFDMRLIPRSQSTVAIDVLPTETPYGGLRGAAVPEQFLYRQSTRVNRLITARGGLGAVRFGPGHPVTVVTQAEPVESARSTIAGYAGVSISPRQSLSVDLTWSHLPVAYTPLSARLGVRENRWEGTINFTVDPRTELHFTYYQSHYRTEIYPHYSAEVERGEPVTVIRSKPDRDEAKGAVLLMDRTFYRERHFAFDCGYWGSVYGFSHLRGTFLGLFNPSFYQRHFATGRLYGNIVGPLGYDIAGDFGIQQIGHDGAFTRAYIATPAVSLRAGERLVVTLGYTRYDVAQAIGNVIGNGVKLTTDWKF